MIRKILLSTAAIAALAGPSLAADLPSRRAPPVYLPPPIPVFTWTGFYVGGQVGYEFGHANGVAYNNFNGIGIAAGGASPSGVIGGAHVGYLYSTQSVPFFGGGLGAGLVFGVEGDVEGSDDRSTYAIGALTDSSRQNIQGSVRGRLGIAMDRTLFYVTGGAAFGGLSNSYASALGFDSYDRTKVGYTIGGGVEYAITNNFSLRAEYRYTDFGSYNDTLVNSSPGGLASVHHHDADSRVEAGFSYKFDTFGIPAPVVARY